MLSRALVVILSAIAAVTCYAMGLHAGLVVFVLCGVLFELFFWVVLCKRNRTDVKQTHPG